MKRGNLFKRLLCLVMVVAMLAGFAVPASAADNSTVTFEQVDNSAVSATIPGREPVELPEEENPYDDNDVVRVSIVLEKASTIDAGYSTMNIAGNTAAMSYRGRLEKDQTNLINKIEKATKEELDVVWNLTLAANIISANVKFGQIEKIEKLAGVKSVVVETQYLPDVVQTSQSANPNMATSGKQIGSAAAWAAGYTGAGSRIAIIDTGSDTDHQSLNAAAFEYSLAYNAGKAGMTVEEYKASLDLLDAAEIDAVAEYLNAYKSVAEMGYELTGEDLYITSKLPYGFNYVDGDLDVTHDRDTQGSHGSHVAGIATANAYIPTGDGFVSALETAYVQGVAPDAQLITMKVFGKSGGAYDSDYMAAIEDAIILGCDAVNLSLGSGNPGMSRNATPQYQAILDSLVDSGVVVAMSTGNSGYWSESAENGIPYNYLDDVSLHTGGSPGSFTNSFSVASVENDGFTAAYFKVGGNIVSYVESTGFTNAPMTSIGGTHEYVLLNAIGEPADFAEVGEEVLKDKVVMCYRGTTSFFEKANAAVEAGAKAVIIVNNQPGLISMDLTDYVYGAPCVSIAQVDGELFKANGTMNTTENGLVYWTGAMEISDSIAAGQYNSEYYTMSSFSSWGVPGSLELKPEITAPGGNIYSINGVAPDGVSYEVMSGTSMASPQVAGMSAVMAQYVRENGLADKTGLDERTLIQSLLMSTAEPMFDAASGGNYYPVIQQGAGLANVGAAVSADSYILMGKDATASYADGKVKAELGDDPDRDGVYSFSFTINNLTDVEKTFVLSADVFTQDAFDGGVALLLDTWTRNLSSIVTWTVNGKTVESGEELDGLDFNGDGVVNNEDGQALLDYATGVRTELTNADKADLNGDDAVNSYDSYLFFNLLSTSGAVVPANGSAKVTVTIKLSDADKAWLANYENGAYIEAYVYAESLSTAEGVKGTTHSIPVLGFYGNWTDASMFDKGSYMEYYYELEDRAPYLLESAFMSGNYNGLTVTYGGDIAEYWFGGNPMVMDETYMPERNAISAANGSTIASVGFTSIRNAADSFFIVKDVASGGYYVALEAGPVDAAYYFVNGGYWSNTYWALNAGFNPAGIPNNTALEVGIMLIPEYYMDYTTGRIDTAALGEGAYFTMPMVVDNTAPALEGVSLNLMDNTLDVTVTDNQYVAAVALYDIYGQYLYTFEGSKADVEAGATVEYALDLSEVDGPSFLLQVYDYAMNTTTYEIKTQIGEVTDKLEGIEISKRSTVMQKGNTETLTAIVYPVNAMNRDVVWTTSNESVVSVDENGTLTANAVGTAVVTAAAAADETITASCSVTVIDINVDMNAVVWDEEGSIWYSEFNTTDLPNYTKLSHDMLEDDYIVSACVGPDGTIYASSLNTSTGGTGSVYTIDPVTYEVTKMADAIVQGLHIFYSDLTYAPGMFGTGALLGTYGPYVMVIDPATGESLGIIDEYDSDLVGITSCYGYYDPDYNESQDAVYVIQNDGTVIQEIYYGMYDYGMIVPYFNTMFGFRAAMDSGVNVGDAWYFNSAYYNGEFLFWSAFDEANENNVTLYAIDADFTGNTYNLGQFADGVWPVGGLHQNYFANDEAAAAAKLAEIRAEVAEKGMPEAKEIELVTKELPAEKEKATGSLNSVANYTAPVRPMSSTEVGESEDTVTVTVTAKDVTGKDVSSTNGVSTVTYDADSLVLKSIVVEGDYISVNRADGSVTFGYVDMDGIAAGETVATLIFEAKNTDAESVTVSHEEVNDDNTGYDEDVAIDYPHLNTEVRDAKSATCTEAGYTGDTYCLDCGKLIAKGEVIPATGHSFGEWTVTTKPDCDHAGVETRSCECGKTETREIAALGHAYEGVVTAPTCTEGGYTTYTCATCGDTYVADEVDALGHDYESVVTEATCTEGGYTTHTCKREGCEFTMQSHFTPAKGHTCVTVVTDPTCTEVGYTTHTCIECDYVLVTDEVEALGHSFGEWTETQAPTCTEAGEEQRTCGVCGEVESRAVAATGHTYEAVVTAPTCTEKGYTTYTCAACGDSYVADEVDALGHAYEAVVTAPTCTEAGYTTYTCACGDSYVVEGEPATGHTWDEGKVTTKPGCETEGEMTYTCECGETKTEKVEALGHNYESKVTKPTYTEGGYTTHTCTECGDSYVDSYTDPNPNGSANTGDAFSMVWVLVMMVSMAGAVVLVLNRKKFLVK